MATCSESGWPSIGEFYAHKDIFITGATGFVGKCLLEKLLRGVPDVGRLFVLVRSKKDKCAQERVDTLLQSTLYERLRNESPDVLKKVVPIAGDVSELGLGISDSDLQLLVENVSVVFHLAATVRFDAPIRQALKINVCGLKEVISLSRKLKKLVSFIHVSTAFSHCNKEHGDKIEEVFYPLKVNPDLILDLLKWMTDEQLDMIAPSLLEGRPNTYTYTKALAEQVLVTEGEGLPISIFRMSIVSAVYKEPLPGWIDNMNGPSGIFVAVGKGILRVMVAEKTGLADFVPVDFVINMLLSIGWYTGINPPSNPPMIYHYTSGTLNPINWYNLRPLVLKAYEDNPFEEVFRRPSLAKCKPHKSFLPLWNFLLHIMPAFFADLLARALGRKPIMVKLYGKLNAAMDKLAYFIENHWEWTHTNGDKLLSLMSERDRELFEFDIRHLDWEKYIYDFCVGTKRYLFNEDLANLPVARQRIKRLRNIRYTFNLLMFLLATRLVYLRSSIARELWKSALGFVIRWLVKIGIPLLHSVV